MRWFIGFLMVVAVAAGLRGLWLLRPAPPIFTSPSGAYSLALPVRWVGNYLVAMNPSQTSFPQAAEVVTFWTQPRGNEQAMPLLTIVAHEEAVFKRLRRQLETPPARLQLASNGRYAFMAYFPDRNPYADYTRAARRFERLLMTPMELAEGFKPVMMEPLKPKKKPRRGAKKPATKTVVGAPKTVIAAPKIATQTTPTLAPATP